MDTKSIGLWSFFIGLVLALTAVFLNLGEWVTQVLFILGILTGVFHFNKNDLISLSVIYLALAAVAGSLDEMIVVGPYISDIVAAWVGFLGPVVLATLMLWGGPFLITKVKSQNGT
jgi:hypothetical protein